MKNVNIVGVHQFLGEEGSQKRIYLKNCRKMEAWTNCRGLGKKQGEGCFLRGIGTPMHTMA